MPMTILVASEVTLWTSPRTKDLGDIVGAYSYTIDVDNLRLKNAEVVVASPPSTADGMTLYGWQPVSGHMTIPSIINGWDVNNNYRTIDWAPTNSTHRFFTVRVEMP